MRAEIRVLASRGTQYRTVLINYGNAEFTFCLSSREFDEWREAFDDDV